MKQTNKKNKTRKSRKNTRKGGFFNFTKHKTEKDNIKDWYLYWKNKKYISVNKPNDDPYVYKTYDNQYRYPGYYNIGLYPIEGAPLYDDESDELHKIPGCQSSNMTGYKIYSDPSYDDNMEKCGANITGDNKAKYNEFWKCKYPKFDDTVNWVKMTKDETKPNCKNKQAQTYTGLKDDLLPDASNDDLSGLKRM
jgi:hypothetical protein